MKHFRTTQLLHEAEQEVPAAILIHGVNAWRLVTALAEFQPGRVASRVFDLNMDADLLYAASSCAE